METLRSVDKTKFGKDSGEIDLSGYQLHKEVDRRRTFIDNDWNNPHVRVSDLAQLGFVFVRKPDQVKCFFCSVILNDFEANDDVLKDHLTFSPNCRLLRRRETQNVPINPDELDQILPPASIDECGSRRKKSRVEDEVAFPQYRLPSERLKSFEMWPISLNQKPQDLVDAGFFYSGQSDIAVCFSCGLYAGKWEKNDNPWVEHNKLKTENCNYLKMNQERLKQNEKKFDESKPEKKPTEGKLEENASEKEIDFDTCCKVCMNRKSSVVLIPCNHVAVCGSCIFGIGSNCPICRTSIEKSIPLIFS
jgi:baculoviral IAP repeat-containing protein 7/8